jgi:predicted nucleic acid-binding protein
LVRWRCDILIAAPPLVAALALIHHNSQDFETTRMALETSAWLKPIEFRLIP